MNKAAKNIYLKVFVYASVFLESHLVYLGDRVNVHSMFFTSQVLFLETAQEYITPKMVT
jgi:hypothetical protein